MDIEDEPGRERAVLLYTRPGCAYCTSLRRGLRRRGLPVWEIDIWQDPRAAAIVRAASGGDEIVPTVVVGPEVLRNPGVDRVLAAVADHLPGLASTVSPPKSLPARLGSAVRRLRR